MDITGDSMFPPDYFKPKSRNERPNRLQVENERLKAEIENLRAHYADEQQRLFHYEGRIAEQHVELERLRAEVTEWRSCARYSPKMEGPAFTGWDRSQMDRCRKRYIEQPTPASQRE